MRRLQTKFVADISRYTENFFLGMSPRQTVFGIAGGAVMVLGSLLDALPDAVAFLAGFALVAAGFWRPDGLAPERYLKAWTDSHLVNPVHRYYQPENIAYDYLWKGKAGGRVCFRPGDFLRKDKELQKPDQAEMPKDPAAEWPDEVPEVGPAAPRPLHADPVKTAATPGRPKSGGDAGTAEQLHERKRTCPGVPPSPPPAPRRMPRYGSGPRFGVFPAADDKARTLSRRR